MAEDGADGNSPFTRALIDNLGAPGKEIRLVFGAVRDSVIAATEGRQKPEIISALGGREYVLAAESDSADAAPVATPGARELTLSAEKIQQTQEHLTRLGFRPGAADGEIGPQTVTAISAFQEASGLPVTGVLDRRTLDAVAIAARFAPPPAETTPAPTVASCPASYTSRVGDPSELSCLCAPQGMRGSVWGTDVYTADSSICRAALHAGVVTNEGGLVSLRGAAGRERYDGSARRGVSTSGWGRYDSSFVFTSQVVAPETADGPQRCPDTAAHLRGAPQSVSCRCEPTQFRGSVWGTDVYTDDSAICQAALHAGVVDAAGGVVEFVIAPGRDRYDGAARNGVNTAAYGAWHGSYFFPDAPQQAPGSRVCPANMQHLRGSGRSLSCDCGADQLRGTVWGDGVYTDDSSLCLAARHAGLIGAEGGPIQATATQGRQGYAAAARNGVQTQSYGAWGGSFVFPDAPAPGAGVAACPRTAAPSVGAPGVSLTCNCPPEAIIGRVWGTDVYTNDSSVCAAAVHAGRIDRNGGVVTIVGQAGQAQYAGSERNGVRTDGYGAWGGSFQFGE